MGKMTRRDFVKTGSVGAAAIAMAGDAAARPAMAGQDNPGRSTVDGSDPNNLNVRAFGAKGDGKTNDTAAIQKALDAAKDIEGTVYVPSGVYICGQLHMHPGAGMIGAPAWDYRESRGSILQLDDSDPQCLLNITEAYGATVQGMCLKGTGPGEEAVTHGIMVDKANYGRQEDTPGSTDARSRSSAATASTSSASGVSR